MRIVTWNVNSLRVRLDRIEGWLAEVEPDVVCMQETKLSDDGFPALTFEALGYETAHYGQGQWNGVAILSRVGLDDVVTNFGPGIEPDPDARIISATCAGVRVSSCYVPNGRALDDPHYTYKLSWLDRLRAHLELDTKSSADVIVAGDFNIAPADVDVFDPSKFVGATHTSDPERARLTSLLEWGLTDLFRLRHPDAARCTRGGTIAPATFIKAAGCESTSPSGQPRSPPVANGRSSIAMHARATSPAITLR